MGFSRGARTIDSTCRCRGSCPTASATNRRSLSRWPPDHRTPPARRTANHITAKRPASGPLIATDVRQRFVQPVEFGLNARGIVAQMQLAKHHAHFGQRLALRGCRAQPGPSSAHSESGSGRSASPDLSGSSPALRPHLQSFERQIPHHAVRNDDQLVDILDTNSRPNRPTELSVASRAASAARLHPSIAIWATSRLASKFPMPRSMATTRFSSVGGESIFHSSYRSFDMRQA